jgi:hypothetical protein
MIDNRPRIAKATRFFARLHSFDLECPHCGDVYRVRLGEIRRTKAPNPNWDPWTGRFTCTNGTCMKKYVLGILAWPIVAAPHVASATPADQVPSPRQLSGLRKEGGGFWMPDEEGQRYPRPHETNITTEEERPDDDED